MKNIIQIAVVFLLAVFVTSCLKETKIQTQEEELVKLDDYIHKLEADGHDVDTTSTGVYYVIMNEGDGLYPEPGDSLTIIYDGYLINGYHFASSSYGSDNGEWSFKYSESDFIEGWNDGIRLINEGAKVQLIIPSNLAYGTNGTTNGIPPNNTLIYVIQMISVKPNYE